jgi:hypothetical protein
MMELALIIYLVDAVDNLKHMAFAVLIFLSTAAVFAPMLLAVLEIEIQPVWQKISRAVTYSLIASVLVIVFVPSQKTAYTMLAAYGVQHVAENPQVQELAGDSLKVLNKAMKEYLADDEPTKTETK